MLGVSTFSMIRFDLDKLDLLLVLVLFLGFCRFCTVFWVLLEGSNVGSEYFFNYTF